MSATTRDGSGSDSGGSHHSGSGSNSSGETAATSDQTNSGSGSGSSEESDPGPVRDHTQFIDDISRHTTNERGIALLRDLNQENVNDGVSVLFMQIWAFYSESWTIWDDPERIAALMNLLDQFDREDQL